MTRLRMLLLLAIAGMAIIGMAIIGMAITGMTTFALQARDLRYLSWAEGQRIPECQEDAVLLGAGQFENGTWDYYTCGPSVDDFTG